MIYVFSDEDLTEGAPRILPRPLVTAALFLPAGKELPAEVTALLGNRNDKPIPDQNRWVIEVWNECDEQGSIAIAIFTWQDGASFEEASSICPEYRAINTSDYLSKLGPRLWQ